MANLSITAAWNETVAFVSRESRLLLPISFMLIALPVAIMEAFAPAVQPGQLPEPGAWIVLVPLVAAVSMTGNIAISYLALTPGTSVAEALRRGARRFLPLFGAAVMLGAAGILLFMVVAVVAVLLVPGAMAAATAGASTPALATATLLTMAILLPVMLYFGTRLMLMTPVAAAQPGGSLAIVARSWRLTAGHVAKLLAFLLLIGLAVTVLTSAIESVAGILFALIAGPLRPGSTGALLVILVMAAVNTVVAAYLASLIARIYAQLAGAEAGGLTKA